MQMVRQPWGVTVYGAASVKAQPDLVRIRFQVTRLEQTPEQAFAVASEAVRAVRQTLRGHGIPDAAVDRSRLDLASEWHYGNERTLIGYQCKAAFAVELRDLDEIQRVLVDLVAAGANEIEGMDFDVTNKAELRAQARRQAVGAARNKAGLYAEEAGVRLGAVVHIEDVDPESERLGYRAHGLGTNASQGDLTPGHVVVSAAVVLGFAIATD
jgi:uncharacterized protein YggE